MSDDSKYEPDSALPLLRILACINYGVTLITTITETLGVCMCVCARASVRVLNYCNRETGLWHVAAFLLDSSTGGRGESAAAGRSGMGMV